MAIPHNVGLIDRAIRLITGIILTYAGFYEASIIPDQFFSVLIGTFGIINICTATVSWCPLYHLISMDTKNQTEV